MLLVREQMDLPHDIWAKNYLTYKNKIVGFAAPQEHRNRELVPKVALSELRLVAKS
jgi:hypothetical protein